GLFNIEINVPPQPASGAGFRTLEDTVRRDLNEAQTKAERAGAGLLMVGVLPTLREQHLGADSLSPNPRYHLLSDQILSARGEDIEIVIDGVDRLWPLYSREEAERVLPAWRELARQAPSAYAAVPYTVAAYLAYLVGDGAQAMMGLEHARAADPCFDMAESLQRALVAGLQPDRLHHLVSGAALAELAETTRPRTDAT
ncbi:MAG: DUF4192 family protein, partial [Actinomycetales bacterium]